MVSVDEQLNLQKKKKNTHKRLAINVRITTTFRCGFAIIVDVEKHLVVYILNVGL
jgi:hypothetical protein